LTEGQKLAATGKSIFRERLSVSFPIGGAGPYPNFRGRKNPSVHLYYFNDPSGRTAPPACTEIVQAIDQWEHRVQNVQAHIDDSAISEGKILIEVSYTIRATNRPDNLVFPFYLEEP